MRTVASREKAAPCSQAPTGLRVCALEPSAPGEWPQTTDADIGLNFGQRFGTEAQGEDASAHSKTPSTTTQWKCTWGLSRAPKRWMKATAPMREEGPAPELHGRKPCSTARRKMCSARVSTAGLFCRKYRTRFGTDSTHGRTGRPSGTEGDAVNWLLG